MAELPECMKITPDDVRMLLACQSHIGAVNLDPCMAPYVYKTRADGVNIINLQATWEKLVLAARIIAGIENPKDVVVVSQRPYGQRAILKLARYLGVQAIAGRFTPGTFTNQIQKRFCEPRLLVVTDPRMDHQAVSEAAYCNLPVIALCGTDSPLRNVDVAIPCNNKGRTSLGLMYWLLTREVLRIRGEIKRSVPWDVMVDLFFYHDPDARDKTAIEDAEPEPEVLAASAAPAAAAAEVVGESGEAPAATTLGDFATAETSVDSTWEQEQPAEPVGAN